MIIWKAVSAGADMPAQKPDPRLNPWRDDLAAAHLRGEIDAPKFVDGVVKQVTSPVATLRRSPADGAMQDSQLLYGGHSALSDQPSRRCPPFSLPL